MSAGWVAGSVRAQHPAVLASLAFGIEVVPERQRGEGIRPLPRRAEGDRQRVPAIDTEDVVGALEPAVAEPA